ncbi:MAG: hypothetical protein J5800_04810 [Spirochaetales bacterium]|nr:hypothetical protein [Spirochaetales bacterium]
MKKTKALSLLLTIMILVVLLTGCKTTRPEESNQSLRIKIDYPSDGQGQLIAPNRHFKVIATVEGGAIPDDAVVRVSLLDNNGNEVRYTESSEKGIGKVNHSWMTDSELAYRYADLDIKLEDVAYLAPELVVRDMNDPMGTCNDATIKCIYTDNSITALITDATEGKYMNDSRGLFHFKDADGTVLESLPEGQYTLRISVSDKDGDIIALAEKPIGIEIPVGMMIFRFGMNEVMNLALQYADEHSLKYLTDPLPGIYGLQFEVADVAPGFQAEMAEYLISPTYIVNYDINQDSVSFREITFMCQTFGRTDESHVLCMDIGEADVAGNKGKLIEIPLEAPIHVYRCDIVTDDASDKQFDTTGKQLESTDLDSSDGFKVVAGKPFALSGATRPYQLPSDEIIINTDNPMLSEMTNGMASIEYTFTCDGKVISLTKPTGLARSSTGEYDMIATMEFYNVFDAGLLEQGKRYEVKMQAIDRNGKAIEGYLTTFCIDVE